MIKNTELYDNKKIVNSFDTTVAEIDTETTGTLAIKATNIELTGNLTNNGNPVVPQNGKLNLYMNGNLQTNEFTANSSTDVDAKLYNIFAVNHQSGATPQILCNRFYYLTGSVTAITVRESSAYVGNNNEGRYMNEFCCMFTAGATSVTVSSYDSRTITWSTEGEQLNDLTVGDVYMMDIIAWNDGSTYYYFGAVKKFKANS